MTVCMSDVINTSMTHTYLMCIRGFLRGLRRLRSSLRPEFKIHREIVVCSWIAQRCDDWLLVSTDQGYQKKLKNCGQPPSQTGLFRKLQHKPTGPHSIRPEINVQREISVGSWVAE